MCQHRIAVVRRRSAGVHLSPSAHCERHRGWKAKSQIVVIFHTNADHPTLHDQAYNKDRNIATENPRKKLITDLMERGVQVELGGATAKAHGWGNADTLPGIKINTDAMSRLTQLVQEGFVKISES